MGKRIMMLLVLAFLLAAPLAAQADFLWHVGYDSTLLSQGGTARLSLGSFSCSASLQYSLTSVVVSAIIQDTEALRSISQLFLVTAGFHTTVSLNQSRKIAIGPKVYGLAQGMERWVVGSVGVDVSYEIWNPAGDQALVLGAFIPLVLYGDMIQSGNGGIGWAWDEFGFALSPSVGYLWRL